MGTTIKCYKCGTYTVDSDYCSSCNTLINHAKRRALERETAEKRRTEIQNEEAKETDAFIEKYRNHKFLIVRFFAEIVYYVWVIVMAIGAFIAWVVSMIAA